MRFLLLLSLLSCYFQPLSAQHIADPVIIAEIDEQVWQPFRVAYDNYDAVTYNNLHTDDVLRVTHWGIKQGEVYKKSNLERFGKSNNPKRHIDFRFEHRIHEGDLGYEVGYYKVVTQGPDATEKVSVGRFHVVLKKVKGVWKIAQDWDTSNINGLEVTEADFERLKK